MEGHVGSRRSFDVVKNTTVTFLVKYCKEIFQKIINVSLRNSLNMCLQSLFCRKMWYQVLDFIQKSLPI